MEEKEHSPLYKRIVKIITSIPKGKVVTYGQVARMAGAPKTARQVSWILSSSSKKLALPWHRVIGSSGKISLRVGKGYFEQKKKLEKEGVIFIGDKVDLRAFSWTPTDRKLKSLLKSIPPHIPFELRD